MIHKGQLKRIKNELIKLREEMDLIFEDTKKRKRKNGKPNCQVDSLLNIDDYLCNTIMYLEQHLKGDFFKYE